MPDAEVIVIGAGMAGLVAARDLAADGRRVVVLEARGRVGGRTWTGTMPGTDVLVEWGGTWVHPESQITVAGEIARYGLEMRSHPAPTTQVWVRDGERHVDHGGDAGFEAAIAAFDPAFEAIGRRLLEATDGDDPSALADLDVSVASWVAQQAVPAASKAGLLSISAAMGGGPTAELALVPILRDGIDSGYSLSEGWADIGVSFVGGTRTLIDALRRDLEVRLGHVVTAVEQDATGVRVRLDDGRRLEAAAVIVTLPLNVWRDVVFDPPLTGGKAGAAERGHPGRASKILAVARGVPAGLAAMGWGTPLQAMMALEPVADAQLLVGFSGEARIDGTDLEEVTSAVRAFVPDAEVVAHGGHDWVGDPFARGAWFAYPVGWGATTLGEDLETPVGRLAFAGGDLPAVGAGWIEGALASGRRAADRVGEILAAESGER